MSHSSEIINPDIEPKKLDLRRIFAIPFWRSYVVVLLAIFTIFFCFTSSGVNSASESGVTLTLPDSVGNAWGIDEPVSEAELALLPKDTEFAKKLYKTRNEQINCQIVLAGSDKRSIHRPEICLPGQGWNIKEEEVIPIQLKSGKTLEVMKILIGRPIQNGNIKKELTSYYIYWFVGKDTTTPYHWTRILKTSWDRVFHKINHRWAYVIVSAPILKGFVYDGKDEKETLDMLKKFIPEIAPSFMLSEKQASKNK
ncbi:MAG: exosortase-associated EpsI family protein [Chthoniobacterales bacterium]